MDKQTKGIILKEIRHLISSAAFDELPEDHYLSAETLNRIMDCYGVHGQQQIVYSVPKDDEEKGYNAWISVYAGRVPDYCISIPTLSSRTAEALNLKVEGRTQKEISVAIGMQCNCDSRLSQQSISKSSEIWFSPDVAGIRRNEIF